MPAGRDLSRASQELEPYFSSVFAAFGDERVMYGSDWPVSLLALPYADTLGLYQNYLQSHQALSSDNFFYRVAREGLLIKVTGGHLWKSFNISSDLARQWSFQ